MMKTRLLRMHRAVLMMAALLLLVGSAAGFSVQPRITRRSVMLSAASKKGFGDTEEAPKKAKKTTTVLSAPVVKEQPVTMNSGQRALAELRRQRAEQRDAELRQVRNLLAADQQMQETPASIPEPVASRMGKRMVPFVGIPLLLTLSSFVAFWYLSVYRNFEFSTSLVAGSSILLLVAGLLGITYSVMSSSWDPDREGSALGLDEFKRNVANVREGLGRSRENAILRDKMSGFSQDELSKALTDLEKREKKQSNDASLKSKLEDELE